MAKNKANTSQWEIPYESGLIEWNLNNVHTAQLYVNFKYLSDYLSKQNTAVKDLFESGFLNINIYNGANLSFAGFLADVSYNKYAAGDFNVNLGVKSWLAYFENRLYSGSFTATDQGQIAWSAINAVNDIGLTQGTITATKNRDRTYKYDNVQKIVTHLSNNEILQGFEFDISNQKVFSAGSRIGIDRPTIIFDEHNIIEYTLDVGLVGKIFNKGYILGGGIGDTQIVRSYDAGNSYVNNWYRLEGLIQDVNVEETVNLDDKVQNFITQMKDPVRKLKIKAEVNSPLISLYSVGDGVRVVLPDVSINEIKRIEKKSVYFGAEEYVTLEFM